MKTHSLFAFLVIASLALTACGGASDPSAAQTAAVQTLDAQLELAQAESALATSQAEQATLEAERDALETQNAQLQIEGTQTANAEATAAAIEPQLIAPDGAACRFGPNAGFVAVAQIEAGVAVDVIGRSTDGEWWQVAHPDEEGETCWVFWDEDLDFLGDVFNLAFVDGPSLPTDTPSPTREPGFAISNQGHNSCNGSEHVVVRVVNTGPETYESARVTVTNVTTSTQISVTDGNNEFLKNSSSCPKGDTALPPGATAYLVGPVGNPSAGDTIRVHVRLCTEDGYGGNCINRSFTYIF